MADPSSVPPPSVPPPPGSSSSSPTGTVEVVVNVNGLPAPLCHVRVASGVYDEVGVFIDPTANPLVFTDVPATVDGLLQALCYPELYTGCTAEWSAVWSGGSFAGVIPEDGAPVGPLVVIEGDTTEVTVDITCAISPPPPPGCCPDVWFCLEGGGYSSYPVGRRPSGVVGNPLRSEAIALRDCPALSPPPVPPITLTCQDCEYTVKGLLGISLENATGELVDGIRYMDFTGVDDAVDQCSLGNTAGLFPTTHTVGEFSPGIVIELGILAGPTSIFVQWTVWAQNMDLYGYEVLWVDYPGYTGQSIINLPDFVVINSDPQLACGSTFYAAKTYIGRIRFQQDGGAVVYGEADVYAQ